MPKLNQIVAVVAGKKTRVEKEFGDLNKVVQKPDLFHGLSRQYAPVEENGEQLPAEQKFPVKHVGEILAAARAILTDIMDAVATQEYGNTAARADVVVDGAFDLIIDKNHAGLNVWKQTISLLRFLCHRCAPCPVHSRYRTTRTDCLQGIPGDCAAQVFNCPERP